MGFGNYDDVGLEKYLQDKKASLNTGVSQYGESLFGNSSKKDLSHLMQLVYAAFREPRYDSTAFLAYVQQQKGILQNMSADPESVFSDSVRYIMSGYDPRSAPQTPKKLDEVRLNRAYAIYKERFLDPADFVFTIVGSFTLDELKPLVEKYIGGISSNGRKEKWKDAGAMEPTGNINRTFFKGHEPRSTVQLMWTGNIKYERRNRFGSYALTTLLNIKLRESLREDKGGVYGVYIYPSLQAVPKERFSMVCGFSCEPAKTNELIQAAKDVINSVKANGCNDADLGKVKETMLKEREIQLRENRFWISYISNADIYNEKLSDVDVFPTWVGELSSDKLKKDAAIYFKDEEMKRFVLDPEETKSDKKK
jgi:zinc protease